MVELISDGLALYNIPFPPSGNQMYPGKIRRYPSKELKQFKQDMELWAALNKKDLDKKSTEFCKQLAGGKVVRISRFFFYPYDRIYTKDGRIKKNDVTNRIKAIDDSITDLMGIDDSLIWEGAEFKCIADDAAHVVVVLSAIDPKNRGSGVSQAISKNQ